MVQIYTSFRPNFIQCTLENVDAIIGRNVTNTAQGENVIYLDVR